MQPFRLEELLRLVAITVTSVIIGIFVYFAYTFAGQPKTDFAIFFMVFIFPMLGIALPTALGAGICLHLILRLSVLPRLVLLPLFVGTGLLLTAVMIPTSLPSELPLVFGITVSAWALYSFGPVRLWKFEYDANEHSDF